ncbi:hypothetical protein AB0425_17665 [Actinosynnema sp. NPDC051121]
MSIKLMWVVSAVMVSAVLAYLPPRLGLAWWWHTLLVIGVWATVTWWGRGELLGGSKLEDVARRRPEKLKPWATAFTFASTIHAIWILASFFTGWWWPLILVAWGVLEWVVAAAWQYRVTHVRERASLVLARQDVLEGELVDEPDVSDLTGLVDPDDLVMVGEALLAGIGRAHYRVVHAEELPGQIGATWQVRRQSQLAVAAEALREARRQALLAGQDPNTVPPPKIEELAALTRKDADNLGLAYQELTGEPVLRDGVDITPGEQVGEVTITVTLREIGTRAIPYEALDDDPRDPNKLVLGGDRRGHPVPINPRQHIKIIGATGSGKSAIETVLIAEGIVRGHVDLCGAEKVFDLAEDLVDNLGDVDMPIRVVDGIEDTLRMIAAKLDLARYRLSLPKAQRVGLRPNWLVITETSKVLLDRSRTVHWNNRDWYADELIGHFGRSTLSAQIYLVLSSQDGLVDLWGNQAGSIHNNTGVTILVRSRNADERRRMLGDEYYGLPNLRQPGEAYIADNAPPVYAKALYPQETGADKPVLHDGPTVADIGRIRARQAREFTSEELAAQGDWYRSLPRRMTDEYRDYLRGLRPRPGSTADQAQPADPAAQLLAEADAAVASWLPAALEAPALAQQVVDAAGPELMTFVSQVVERPPLRTRIVELVETAGRLGRKEVLAALLAEGYDTSQQSVDNALSALARKNGPLKRDRLTAGVYLPAHASLTSPAPAPVSAGGGARQA